MIPPRVLPRWLQLFFAPFTLQTWGGIGGAALGIVGNAVVANNTKKPQTAEYKPVDLQAEQNKAIQGNLANESSVENLLKQSNTFAQQQANSLMEQAVPGYSKFAASLLKTGQQALDNPYAVPQEVQDNLTRIAAERGVTRGTRGQFNSYSALRDLGVNMLDYGNSNFSKAMAALSGVTGTAPRISPMSPMSFYVTPGMSAANAQNESQMNQAIQQGSYNADAALSNYKTQSLWDSIAKGVGMIDWGGISKGKSQSNAMKDLQTVNAGGGLGLV